MPRWSHSHLGWPVVLIAGLLLQTAACAPQTAPTVGCEDLAPAPGSSAARAPVRGGADASGSETAAGGAIRTGLVEGARFTLTRATPWTPAAGCYQLGVDPRRQVTLAADLPTDDETGVTPGSITLSPRGVLSFTGFQRAGEFTSKLTFSAPAAEEPTALTVKVRVTDAWLWPGLAAILGVVAGSVLSLIAKRWRPRLAAAERIERLQARLNHLSLRIASPASAAISQKIDRRLADLRHEPEQVTEQDLASVAQDIAALGETLDKAAADAAETRARAATTLMLLRRAPGLTPGDLGRLADIEEALFGVGRTLDEGRDERAAKEAEALREQVTREVGLLVNQATTRLQARIAAASLPDAKKNELTERLAAISPDDLVATVKTLDDVAAAIPAAPAPLATARAAGAREVLFAIEPAPREPRAGAPVGFSLTGPLVERVREVLWSFGTTTRPGGSSRTSHVFRTGGAYPVVAEILLDDGSRASAATSVSVADEAATTSAKRFGRRVAALDWLVFAIAAVVAVASALGAKYFGQAFGSPADYLALILWGLGVDAATARFADLLSTFRGQSAPAGA